nr:uncharacterized protein LOC100175121 [Ciona intestinalis]|eukprot:XP_026696679.1 uncharacterized protein LOC100175121 [Ciona intestinalis]
MASLDMDVDTSQLDKAIHELDDIYAELKNLKNRSSSIDLPKQGDEGVYSSPKSTPINKKVMFVQVPTKFNRNVEARNHSTERQKLRSSSTRDKEEISLEMKRNETSPTHTTFQQYRSSSARTAPKYTHHSEANNKASARNWPPIIINSKRKLSSPAATSHGYYEDTKSRTPFYQNYSKSLDKRGYNNGYIVSVDHAAKSKTLDRRSSSHREVILPPPPYVPHTSPVRSDSGSDYDEVASNGEELLGTADYDVIPDPVPVTTNEKLSSTQTLPYVTPKESPSKLYSTVDMKKKRASVVFVEETDSRRQSSRSSSRRKSSHSTPERNQTIFSTGQPPSQMNEQFNEDSDVEWDDDEWDLDSKGTSRRASRAAVISTTIDGPAETSFGEPRAFPVADVNKNNNGRSDKDGECMWCRILMAIFTLLACLMFILMIIGYIIIGINVDNDIRDAYAAAANSGTT